MADFFAETAKLEPVQQTMTESEKTHKDMELSQLEERVRDVLLQHPDGLDITQIRQLAVEPGDPQEQLDRRIRAVRAYYYIAIRRDGKRYLYVCKGPKPKEEWGAAQVNQKDRAQALHHAHGRCEMCGRTIAEDGVKLVIDHKIPQSWGGGKEPENLWAICSECNGGKKHYFATFDAGTMKKVLRLESVHRRLLSILEMSLGEWVDSDLLEFVANFRDAQQDWQKRLRELRYFGLTIEPGKARKGNRIVSRYKLLKRIDNLPEDLTAAARSYEKARAARNRDRI